MKNAGLNAIRIPVGYWAVDLQDDEPYVAGQYPYLIQAVQWAREVGLQVMIDLHGAPGSQNGQDNSGLIGPVLFASNASNADRSLNVLRNLTDEFSQSMYGGAVMAIELLNEPRLEDENFSMSQLKEFYADGAEVVRSADSNSISVAIHGKSSHHLMPKFPTQPANSLPRCLLGPLLLVVLHAFLQYSRLRLPHSTNPHPRHTPILRLPTLRQSLPVRHPRTYLRNLATRQELLHPPPHRRRRIQPRNKLLSRLGRRRRQATGSRWPLAGAEDVVSAIIRGAGGGLCAERKEWF
jgi:hypothetical protein